MFIIKKSFFLITLSSIVLFASTTPALAALRFPRHKLAPKMSTLKPESNDSAQVMPQAFQPEVAKKTKLTWQQKLRKKIRQFKTDIAELLGEHPVRNVAAVVAGALVVWLAWDKLANPWTHREAVLGQSACDILEAVVPQGEQHEIVQHLFENDRVLDQEAEARGERVFVDGEMHHRVEHNRFRLENPANILQLRCAYQTGPECAYHAIKNCMVILNALAHPENRDLQQQLTDYALSARLFRFNQAAHGVWRQRILAEREAGNLPDGECNDQGDWLRGDAVQDIIDYERRPADNNPRLLVDQNTQISIIEDARMIANPNLDPQVDPIRLARAGFAHPGVYTHGFIFNTARTALDENGGLYVPRGGKNGGHWMAVVLHRNAQGEVRWYCANSTNGSMLHNDVMRDLIAAVQGAVVQ